MKKLKLHIPIPEFLWKNKKTGDLDSKRKFPKGEYRFSFKVPFPEQVAGLLSGLIGKTMQMEDSTLTILSVDNNKENVMITVLSTPVPFIGIIATIGAATGLGLVINQMLTKVERILYISTPVMITALVVFNKPIIKSFKKVIK